MRNKLMNLRSTIVKNHRKIVWWSVFIVCALLIAYSGWLILMPTEVKAPILAEVKLKKQKSNPTKYSDFGLVIPKIELDLPVIPDVDGNNKDAYLEALQSGVAHFVNTAKPDESGNIFIFGHSSDWRWRKGDFKTAFIRLPEINKDDEISLWYKGVEQIYKVDFVRVTEPTDLSWLDQNGEDVLTLMTCYPINTDKQRFIVRAKKRS